MGGWVVQDRRDGGDDPEAVVVDVVNGEGFNQGLGAISGCSFSTGGYFSWC